MATYINRNRYSVITRSQTFTGLDKFYTTTINESKQSTDFEVDSTSVHNGGFTNHRYRLAHGIASTTPASGVKKQFFISPGSIGYRDTGPLVIGVGSSIDHRIYEGHIAPYVVPSSLIITPPTNGVSDLALSRFINNAFSARTAVLGGAFIKELRETVHMIRHPAQALRTELGSYLSRLRKVRRRIPKQKKRKVLGDTWLEYSFGMKPLIADIEAAKQKLRELPSEELIPISSYAEEPVVFTTTKSTVNVGAVSQDYITYIRGKVSCRYKGAIKTAIPFQGGYLSQTFGFDLSSFVPTLWEIIPYSFLVDYFTNIGDILTYHSGVSSNVSWFNLTTRVENVATTVPSGFRTISGPPAFWTRQMLSKNAGSSGSSYSSFFRSGGSVLPIPEFRYSIPGASSTRWINMSALLLQARGITPF